MDLPETSFSWRMSSVHVTGSAEVRVLRGLMYRSSYCQDGVLQRGV
jgi:hypothetical protein